MGSQRKFRYLLPFVVSAFPASPGCAACLAEDTGKNKVLPLRKGAAVSVFGKAAVKPVLSSSAAVKGAGSFKAALEEEKIRVNDKLWEFMDRGGGNSFSKKVEKSLEDFSEAAIVVIGRSGSDTDL